MAEWGPLACSLRDEQIYLYGGADRDDVPFRPRLGVDHGVVSVGDSVLAAATGPFAFFPSLGPDRAANVVVHRLLSDVAITGLDPTHLSLGFTLPPAMDDEQFETLWRTVDRIAADHGVAVATGHTGRYDGCTPPMIGGGTAVAVGDPEDLVDSDGAGVGDRIVVTRGPAVGATGVLASRFESRLREEVSDAALDAATACLDDVGVIQDARTLAAHGSVTAMHHATDGGLYGALYDLARASDVAVDVERERVPIARGVHAICEAIDVDPWTAFSAATLVATVSPDDVDATLAALDGADVPAADVGAVVPAADDSSRLVVDGDPIVPRGDPFWTTYDRGAAGLDTPT